MGTESNRCAFGARIRVVVETATGPREIHRAVGSVSSFGGSPRRQEIGLGNATSIRRIEVWWPRSDTRQVFQDVSMDGLIRIEERAGEVELLPLREISIPVAASSDPDSAEDHHPESN